MEVSRLTFSRSPTEHNTPSGSVVLTGIVIKSDPYDTPDEKNVAKNIEHQLANGKQKAKETEKICGETGNNCAGKDMAFSSRTGDCENPEADDEDPWALPELTDTSVPWSELNTLNKVKRVASLLARGFLLIGLLYLFICSLDFLSSAFRLLGGKAAGETLGNSELLSNPVAGVMIGVLATVLVQSSSTSTSIIVAMVSSDILSVRLAIPMIMGANVGTTVTNTLVAIGQANNKGDFRRAFAAATVHDMFNWLCIICLMPLEVASGYLYRLTDIITDQLDFNTTDGSSDVETLQALTDPFTVKIIELSSSKIEAIALGEEVNGSLIEPGSHLFSNWNGSDAGAGAILLVAALALLCTCLVLIVKLLSSLLKGAIAKVIQRVINADFPGPFKHVTGYFVILVGAGMTILVQSSSIFTSAMTPLVGIGAIHLERMYPLTIGSNIGTTVTGILAALTADASTFRASLQIALCHLFFNLSGLLIWYPFPVTRKVPVNLAKCLGDIVSRYRWFALAYLVIVYFLLPLLVFGLSLAGWQVITGVGVPVVLLIIFIVVVNIMQSKCPHRLPKRLQSWQATGIPAPFRSLAPYDVVCVKIMRHCTCIKNTGKREAPDSTDQSKQEGRSRTDESNLSEVFTIVQT